jgi:penicillin-binding protein 2
MRNYPSGAAVAHLVGYVGAATAEEYKKDRDPLLITPGYKVGKDNLEQKYDAVLRGKPGARRAEVTAGGKLVRELETVSDTPGKPLKLTINAELQAYAARRMGMESGSMVIIDCETGDILAFVSMPAFDPNAMSDGISKTEWSWLNDDERKPLLNKASRGLYPPGSTLKPMAALAALMNGVDPKATVFCGGGYRLGNRVFKCLGRHGSVNMATAIEKSCNTFFYANAHRLGYDKIAPVAKMLGLGQEFDLPGINQRYGTIPDSSWKQQKYKQVWSASDSLNAMIGQGYVSVSPLQLAVMSARIASGKMLIPRIIAGKTPAIKPLPFPPEMLAVVHEGMNRVVNGNGTAVRSRLPVAGVKMAGKTGTAQVRAIKGAQRGQSGARKYRDHGLFVCYAPTENPKYAASVVIEHGLGGARAAAPVASDVLSFLFDPEAAMAKLESLEAGWGGSIKERMARDYGRYRASKTGEAPPPETPSSPKASQQSPAPANINETPRNADDDSQPEASETEAIPIVTAQTAPSIAVKQPQ